MVIKKGQGIIEYALMLSTIIVAFVLLQHYVSRGMQGQLTAVGNSMGQQFDPRGYFMYAYKNSDGFVNSEMTTRAETTLFNEVETVSFGIFDINIPAKRTGYNLYNEAFSNYKQNEFTEPSIETVLPWE